MPEPIKSRRLIAVEGKDEINFVTAYYKHIMPKADFDIREVGGKDQFKDKIGPLKKISGFSAVEEF